MERSSVSTRVADHPVDLLLVERGRLSTTHPIWASHNTKLIVSFEGWRGKFPVGEWSSSMKTIAHEDVGGVTDGKFRIFVAARRGYDVSDVFHRKDSASAKLVHVLDPLESGKRVKIPEGEPNPEGTNERGLLRWTGRFDQVTAPTVYSRVHWVRRRLSHKELVSVLDLPPTRLKEGDNPDAIVAAMEVPGKIRVRVLEELSDLIVKKLKRPPTGQLESLAAKRARLSSTIENRRPRLDLDPPGVEESPEEACIERLDTTTVKATKADDAKVPIFLWDDQVRRAVSSTVSDAILRRACDSMRNLWCLPRWKRNVSRGFFKWFKLQVEQKLFLDENDWRKSLEAGAKAIRYAEAATWWTWDGGSYPFFWRWELPFRRDIRDGLAPRFNFDPPACFDRQTASKDPQVQEKERDKISKVILRGYLCAVALSWLKSLMHYFSVPKGDDIRMVYDGSKSGLNSALYCPWFAVPTSQSLEHTIMPYSYQADNDFGDMFLNFQLHEELQKYTGVDVSDLFPEMGTEEGTFVAWDQPAMGLKSSPYTAVQCSARAKRMIMGDPRDPNNPFAWRRVFMNLPATEDYDPTQPWMFKQREDGLIAGDAKAYIDDYRESGHNAQAAWKASSRVAKIICWLGMQDSPRKRRGPSQRPGAWSGTIIHTGEEVRKMVSQERWEKTQQKIEWISSYVLGTALPAEDEIVCAKGEIPHKKLESYRGFLVYVSRTYTSMVPYLKGIHLTLDSWREGRTATGWANGADDDEGCFVSNVIDDRFESVEMRREEGQLQAPKKVMMAPRLVDDISALMALTRGKNPPSILVRPYQFAVAYLFGDASGAGYGTSLYISDSLAGSFETQPRNMGKEDVKEEVLKFSRMC